MARKQDEKQKPDSADDNKAAEQTTAVTGEEAATVNADEPATPHDETQPEVAVSENQPAAEPTTVTLETVAEATEQVAAETATTLSAHVIAAAKFAQADADHVTHGVLENFTVHLHEFKARLVAIEGKLEGDAAALFEQIKKLL